MEAIYIALGHIKANLTISKVYLIVILQLFIAAGYCADLDHKVDLPLKVQYETNPTLSTFVQKSVVKRVFTPKYILTAEDERNIWKADFSYYIERSSDESLSGDRDDPAIDLGWKHKLQNGEFGLKLYSDKRSTRETELDDTGRIILDGTRKTRNASIAWEQNLNEKISVELTTVYDEITYEEIDLIDHIVQAANFTIFYMLSEYTQYFIEYGKTTNERETTQSDDELTHINIGIDWKASNNLDVLLYAGSSESESDNIVIENKQGGVTFDYKGNRNSAVLSVSRSVKPSGTGGFLESDQVKANWNYDISDKDLINAVVNYRENFDLDYKTHFIAVSYIKELGEDHNLTLYASNKTIESTTNDAENNSIGISISYILD